MDEDTKKCACGADCADEAVCPACGADCPNITSEDEADAEEEMDTDEEVA